MKQHRVRIQVEIENEQGTQPKAQVLDAPALVHRGIAEQLFDQRHSQHRVQQLADQ